MFKNSIVMFFIFCVTIVKAQNFTIKGIVIDENSQRPVENSMVLLVKNDSVISYKTIDDTGFFVIQSERGEYQLQIEKMGEMLYEKDIQLVSDINLGEITILNNTELEGIVIDAVRKIKKEDVDKTTIFVKNQKIFEGDDAMKILSKVQGFLLLDDQLSYNGEAVSSIRINNQPMHFSSQREMFQFLKSLGNSSIESIEIINKSAKNFASNNGKTLNIKTNQSVLDGFSINPSASFSKGIGHRNNIGVFSQFKKNKLSANVFLDYSSDKRKTERTYTTHYNHLNEVQTQVDDIWIEAKPMLMTSVNLQYDFNENTVMGLAFSGDKTKFADKINSQINQQNQVVKNSVSSSQPDFSKTFSWFLDYKIDTLQSVRVEANYNTYTSESNQRLFTNSSGSDAVVNQYFKRTTTTPNFNVDYNSKLFGKIDFSAGLHYLLMDNNEEGLINSAKYKENVFAKYVSLLGKNKIVEYQIGLRGEHTKNLFQKYYNLFPSITLRKNIGEDFSVQTAYNKIINRPMGFMLSPNLYYYNEYSATLGNSNLVAEIRNQLSVVFSYKNWSVSNTFMSAKNSLGSVPDLINSTDKLIVTRYVNMDNMKNFSGELSYSYFDKNFYITPMIIYYYGYFQMDKYSEKIKNHLVLFNLSTTYNINDTNRIDATFKYHFKNKEWYSNRSAYSQLDISYNKKFKNNLNLSIFAKDIYRGKIEKITSNFQTVNMTESLYKDSQQFGISLQYFFEKGQSVDVDEVRNNMNRK